MHFSDAEMYESQINELREANKKLLERLEYLTSQIREQNGEIRDYMKREREQRRQIQQQQQLLEERNAELERQQEILVEQSRQIEMANTELEAKNLDLASEKSKSEELLLNILPQSIMSRLQNGETVIADYFADVTVIFADIVGFTQISATQEPETVVQILNWVFSIFDGLTERFGLEKIKTIGDAYMVASGIPKPRADHSEAAAFMALSMVRDIQDFSQQSGMDIQVRVGMHTGPVVAGIIGRKKFIYDLWGDTVNLASRMESHGEANKVHCSEAVAKKIASRFTLRDRGTVHIKGKGDMKTYFLTGVAQK